MSSLPIAQIAFFSISIIALLLWQLVLLPKFVQKSHYQVLGIKPGSTTDDITNAYRQLISLRNLDNGGNWDIKTDLLQIHHAFEILSDPLRRRDYDHFDHDELREKVKSLQKQVCDASFKLQLPLWEPFNYELLDSRTVSVTSENFGTLLEGEDAWLIQTYSVASRNCKENERTWKQISEQMDGVARVGRVELGNIRLASFFAETNRATGNSFFRHGLPAYVAFPPNCRNQNCIERFAGEISVDGVVNWMATHILRLPRILYYSPQTVVSDFIRKSGSHKVKVVIFSKTGERAVPFIRKAAKDFWEYAVFGLVLWREENAPVWETMFGVDSAPAVLFLKDPGIGATIFYDTLNSSAFEILMQEHKTHVLPQLRSVTADKLGCNDSGYSLAGKNIHTWYCVIVAGRPGFELSQARGVMREVQGNLTNEVSVESEGDLSPHFTNAVLAFKEKRLTLAWLDGLAQKKVCYFYLSSERVYETCGPKHFPEQKDAPQVFLVRYRRHPKDREKYLEKKNRLNSIWQKLLEEEDIASQIVAKYNGSLEVSETVIWISKMIKEGDSEDLLFYIKKAPALVPEESKPAWLVSAQSFALMKSKGLFSKCRSFIVGMFDYVTEPKFTPTIALIVVLYVGGLLFKSRQRNRQGQQQGS